MIDRAGVCRSARVLLLFLLLLLAHGHSTFSTDLVRLNIVRTNAEGLNETLMYRLPYDQRLVAAQHLAAFCDLHGVSSAAVAGRVSALLSDMGVSDHAPDDAISSADAVFAMLNSHPVADTDATRRRRPNGILSDALHTPLYFIGHDSMQDRQFSNPHVDKRFLVQEALKRSEPDLQAHPSLRQSMLPDMLRGRHRIIVYQTRGVRTGGTVALNSLHETLVELGYNAIVCGEENHMSPECVGLTGTEVVVTGEWCRGVMQDHGVLGAFRGRGVQYHLGFHQASGHCRGHVPVTDSQFLHVALGRKILGAFYLGCPMRASVKEAWLALVATQNGSVAAGLGATGVAEKAGPRVVKEDLVVIDPDLMTDYPPAQAIAVHIPDWIRVVKARDIQPDMMPLLLQRAKVVVDLAMPGPERLAGEGVLMGAVPIVSNRWNGASDVDFPRLLKVDHQNATDISTAIVDTILNYDAMIQSLHRPKHSPSVFMAYVLSLWRRAHFTVDTYFGSSFVHFVLAPATLQQEMLANFQVLAILHLFPLASIDIYVVDPLWYIRHHYEFYSLLKSSGYIRLDPLDSADVGEYSQPSNSYVRVRALSELLCMTADSGGPLVRDMQGFLPAWDPVAVVLDIGAAFESPDGLFSVMKGLNAETSNVRLSMQGRTRGVVIDSSCSAAAAIPLINSMFSPEAAEGGPTTDTDTATPGTDIRQLLVWDAFCGQSDSVSPASGWLDQCGVTDAGVAAACGAASRSAAGSPFIAALRLTAPWRTEAYVFWQTMSCAVMGELFYRL